MKYAKILGLGLLVAALAVTGCSQQAGTPKADDKKECTVLVLGTDEKTPTPVAAKELTVTTKETKTKEGVKVAPLTIKMLPKDEKDGKASKYVGTDPGLGNVADVEGTVLGEIGGRPSQGEFKE